MKKITLKDPTAPKGWRSWFRKSTETFEICTEWKDVKLRQYVLCATDMGFEPVEQLQWQVAALSTIPLDRVQALSQEELLGVAKHLTFLKTKCPTRRVEIFECEGEDFFAYPHLAKTPLGMYAYADMRVLKIEQNRLDIADGKLSKAPELIAMLVAPKATGFDARRIKELALKFQNLDVPTALSIVRFFFQTCKIYGAAFLLYLKNQQSESLAPKNTTTSDTTGSQ